MDDRNKKLKVVITVMVFFSMLIGFLAIVKGYISLKPFRINISSASEDQDASASNNTFSPNTPGILGIEQNKVAFGEKINNLKSPNLNYDSLYLFSIGKEFNDILKFNGQEFEIVYSTANEISEPKIYEDGTITLLEFDKRFFKLQFLMPNDVNAKTYYEFEIGSLAYSYFFNPNEKSFYIFYSLANGEFRIDKINALKNVTNVFRNADLSENYKIQYFNSTSQRLILKENENCHELDLATKNLKKIAVTKCLINPTIDYENKTFILEDGIFLWSKDKKELVKTIQFDGTFEIVAAYKKANKLLYLKKTNATLKLFYEVLNLSTNEVSRYEVESPILPNDFFIYNDELYLVLAPKVLKIIKKDHQFVTEEVTLPSNSLDLKLINEKSIN